MREQECFKLSPSCEELFLMVLTWDREEENKTLTAGKGGSKWELVMS